MICSERSCVFPLRISDSIAFADCNPSIFASGNGRTLVRPLKPWNNTRRFGPVAGMCFVIVGKCTVKWILPRCEFHRQTTAPIGRVRIIKTAIAFCPLFVPCTCAIRDEIIATRLLADPKECSYDICFPPVPPSTPRGGRFRNDRLVFFNDSFDLSGKRRMKRDEESETKKAR